MTIPNVPLIGLVSKFVSLNQQSFLKVRSSQNKPIIVTYEVLRIYFQLLNTIANTGSPNGDISSPAYNPDFIDSVFITGGVNDLLFGGFKHGALRYFIEKLWGVIQDKVPPQIKEENGFALFNGKNDTAYFE